jgi:Mn2+/Fe2+ NRAMP family transporter
VLIAVAATRFSDARANLGSIGEISSALSPLLGEGAGHIAFGLGVLGGSLAAAVVSALALAWGFDEIAGYGHSLRHSRYGSKWFFAIYASSLVCAAALVWSVQSLVWLNITAQVINAFVLPMVIGFLLVLAAEAVPEPRRIRGWYLRLVTALSVGISAVGLFGGILGLL